LEFIVLVLIVVLLFLVLFLLLLLLLLVVLALVVVLGAPNLRGFGWLICLRFADIRIPAIIRIYCRLLLGVRLPPGWLRCACGGSVIGVPVVVVHGVFPISNYYQAIQLWWVLTPF
jgi:hypothetical protein